MSRFVPSPFALAQNFALTECSGLAQFEGTSNILCSSSQASALQPTDQSLVAIRRGRPSTQ